MQVFGVTLFTFGVAGGLAVAALTIGAISMLLFKRKGGDPASELQGGRIQVESHAGDGQRAAKLEFAAIAGMVGELLDQYLRSRFYHLMLIYPDSASLKKRLNEVQDEYAAIVFFYFCSLIALAGRHELRGGAMSLLSSSRAHDYVQQLLNTFLSSIPQGEGDDSIDTFTIERDFSEFCRTDTTGSQRPADSSLLVREFVRGIDPFRYCSGTPVTTSVMSRLRTEFAAYKKWLGLAGPGLIVAAEALRTLHNLITNDLRALEGSRVDERAESVFRTLSDALTPTAVEAVFSESARPHPIGVRVRKAPALESTTAKPDGREQPASPYDDRKYNLDELEKLRKVLAPQNQSIQQYAGRDLLPEWPLTGPVVGKEHS